MGVNFVIASLRQLRPPSEVPPMQLGNCISVLPTIVPNKFENANDDEVRARFWSMAREQSNSLEDRVKNDMSKFVKPDSFSSADFEEMKKLMTGLMYHVNVSNIGVVDLTPYECFSSKEFIVENMFTTVNNSKTIDNYLVVMYFNTIADKLMCSIGTNAYFFDPVIADEFLDLYKRFFDFVL